MISIFIDYKLTRFQNEIRYAFSFIFQTLGYGHCFISDTGQLKENDILFIYGYTDPTVDELKRIARHYITIFIQSDPGLFEPGAYSVEKLRRSLKTIKLLSMTPVISARKFDYPAENYSDSSIHAGKINFDLVGNIFFHLAEMEPRIDSTRTPEGYYPEEASQFHPQREMPYVDNLLWLVDSMIKEHTRAKGVYIVQKQYWPEAQQAAATLSHSVDNLQKWSYASLILSVAVDLVLLVTLNLRQLFNNLAGKFRFLFTNIELYWNFDEFRELEREAGFRSTWFIAPEKNDFINYNLDDADLQEEIGQLQRDGNDVALLMTADKLNRDEFVSRKQIMLHQLHKQLVGIRQLNYRMNETLRDLHNKLAPSFSQSTARQESPGYVSGVSVPYQPWIAGLKASFWELPTVFHDAQLKVNRYKYLQLDAAKHLLKKFFQNTLRARGVFGLDLSLASYADIHYCRKFYSYALELIKASGAWVPTAEELVAWWEKRGRVTIEEAEYEISVYFPDEMEHFCLQIFNDAKIKEIEGLPGTLEGNLIRFAGVPAGSIAVIRLNKDA
ncbi:MAG: hypothetical protein K0B87_05835 [Candidatus Syntrophosphaera sp.]|nr:hypothetical protein [Candidatus Syntrophosphaera sp.]